MSQGFGEMLFFGLLVLAPAVFALAILVGSILLLRARTDATPAASTVMLVFSILGFTAAAGIGACYGLLLIGG